MMFNEKYEEMCVLFNTRESFMDVMLSALTKKYHIDIFKLDDWCKAKHGYSEEKDGCLRDFVEKTFGEPAAKFVLDNL